jgi:DNA-binding NtrC family response regulator
MRDAPETKRQRILIVEDQKEMSDSLREMLQSADFDVVTAIDAVEAWSVVFDGGFDVVICDWVMPIVNGDVFYRKVESIDPALCDRFIFMTGHLPVTDIGRSIQHFVQEINAIVLYKPFSSESLFEAVSSVLHRRK